MWNTWDDDEGSLSRAFFKSFESLEAMWLEAGENNGQCWMDGDRWIDRDGW